MLLSACQSGPRHSGPPAEVVDRQIKTEPSQPESVIQTRPLGEYILPADGNDQLLDEAEAMLGAGMAGPAAERIAEIDAALLSTDQQLRLRVIEANIKLLVNGNQQAFTLLTGITPTGDASNQAGYYQTLARACMRIGDSRCAAQSLVQRDQLLPADSRLNNQQLLWGLLSISGDDELRRLLTPGTSATLEGWLELALQMRATSPANATNTLNNWRINNPAHPAETVLLEQIGTQFSQQRPLHQVALLLPLSSDYQAAAGAINDGFVAMNNDRPASQRYSVKVYDYGRNTELVALYYRQAVNEGADIVIGPLGREAVEKLVNASEINVKTLLLTAPPEQFNRGDQPLLQFTLSQELEAEQVARRAWLDGYRRSVMLYPDTPLGQRMQAAFKQTFEQLGGSVVATASFARETSDFSDSVSRLLGVDESQRRIRDIENILSTKVVAEGRRRQDIDFVFLPAQTETARLIKPVLDFYYALDLPVYTTSRIFSGKPDAINDVDLNRIRFPDMPWMIATNVQLESLRTFVQGAWPSSETRYDRLYAVGMDIHSLLPLLAPLQDSPALHVQGVSGNLSIDRQGIVNRQMLWAVYQGGIPRLLEQSTQYQGRYDEQDQANRRQRR